VADSESPDGYRCRCEVKEDGRLVEEACDLCKSTSPPPEAKCHERSELLILCNPLGTESITPEENCVCKNGYEGEQCRECSEGFMKSGDKCLPCYCAGTTKSCRASDVHFFENISLANPGRYKFDVFMSRKLANGELAAVPLSGADKARIERVHAVSNVHKFGPPEDLIIREPLARDGISQVTIKLMDTQRGATKSDLPVYRYLYGGKMSFRFKRAQPQRTGKENQVVVTIESPKFGTAWTTANFNPKTQRYEVVFSEDWWKHGWRLHKDVLSRAALLRVLGTASSIGIPLMATNNGLENARIGGLSFELARDFTDDVAAAEGLRAAPVEVCDCEGHGGRSLSPSCEGCTDLSKSTAVRLDPSGPDFECGACEGPNCDTCEAGQFKYDFLTNEVYEKCQKGVEMDTEGRVVVAEPGSRVSLTCRATSYRGGIAVHTWRLPAHVAGSTDISIRRELLPFKPKSETGKWEPITSETQLQIDNAKKEYSGLYECQVAALGVNLTEPFYLVIRDPDEEPPSEPGDTLNEEFPVPMPVPDAPPATEFLTADTDPEDPTATVLQGKVYPPTSLDNFHLVWLSPNGTQMLPLSDPMIDSTTGEFRVRLPIDLTKVDELDGKINGFLVGKDPINTPIWVPLPPPTRIKEPLKPEDMPGIRLNQESFNLSFLEPAKIRVVFADGKPKNVKIKWRRLEPTPVEDPAGFLPGMGVTPDGDLVIWAAGEEHEGTYEAEVTNPETGDVVRLNTTIRVAPMLPPKEIPVSPGSAGESPEEVRDVEPPQPTADDAFVYYVTGFTPSSVYCARPKWTLMDKALNTSKDISDRVNRESESRFVINYPLSSGKYIKFECLPVPTTNLTGSLHFDVDSPDLRVIILPEYDDPYSIFPTRLVCAEGNPDIKANVTITSDGLTEQEIKALENPASRSQEFVELDWRRVGGFRPFKYSRKYTCTAKSPTMTVEKSVTIRPRVLPGGMELIQRPTPPKLTISSPGQALSHEGDDNYRLGVTEGQPAQIIAEYDSPSKTGEITWTLDDSKDVPEVNSDGDHSWTRVNISEMPRTFDDKVLAFVIDTPEGEKTARVTLEVRPADRSFAIVHLNSTSLVNGDLIGLTGGDMAIDVKSFGPDGSELPGDLETFWRVTQANGAPVKLDDGVLAERYAQPKPYRLELQGLPRRPTEFRIFAGVVVPFGEKKELFTSIPHRLIVREGLIQAYVVGLTGPDVLSGPELSTVGATCVAHDVWRNKTVREITYDWDYVIRPDGAVTQLPTSTDKIQPEVPKETELPWSVMTFHENSVYFGQLKSRPGWTAHLRCRAKSNVTGQLVVSEWFKLNVIPIDMTAKFPVIEIRPTFDPEVSRFPVKVECVDTNTKVPSTVTWSKDDQVLPPSVKMETAENSAVISWSVSDSNEFAPRALAGMYTCEAKNEFRTVSERLFLPDDIMEKHEREKVPITKDLIRIMSPYAPIEEVDGVKQVKLEEGGMFELICEYYGYPPPADGVSWRLKQGDDEGSTGDALAQIHGLVWERGRNYWASVQSDAFNQYAPQTGVYTCEAIDKTGHVIASDSVTVAAPVKEYNVEVLGLDDYGVLYLRPGGEGRVSCRVTDAATGEVVATFGRLKKLQWDGPLVETEKVKTLDDVAHTVQVAGEDLHFQGVHADLPEELWGRCTFFDGKVRKESKPFRIVVQGEGGTDGKVKTIVVEHPRESPNKRKFQCDAFDTTDGHRVGDATVTWYFVTPGGHKILPGHLFKHVETEGRTIVLTDLREDVDLSMLAGGESTVEGRCAAYIPETMTTYPSEPFMTLAAKDADKTPEFIDREEKDDKPLITIKGDDRGQVQVEEGKDVSLKCAVEETLESPKLNPDLTYHWLITRKDGRPVDTSVIADRVEVVPLAEGGLELKLTGLRASAAGLAAKCLVRNETKTDDAKPAWINFDKGGDVVTFSGDKLTDPGQKPPFTGTPEYETVPENDKKNRYTVKIEGLDESGRLAAPEDSDVSLKVKIIDKETGEEVPLTDPAWRAAGVEVQHADGLPAPLSHLANQVHVDSKTGEIKLTGYKGDSNVDKAGDLFVRVVVEKMSTESEDEWKPKPGQTGDPRKERFASPFAQVVVSDRTEPEDRQEAEKPEALIAVVHGLTKCHTLALEKGKDLRLTCRARGVEDTEGLVFDWELRNILGQRVPMDVIAKTAVRSDNELHLSGMRVLADEYEVLLGRCVIARKTGDSAKYYSRDFVVGPSCKPAEPEEVRVVEIPSKDPSQRLFRCVATKRTDGSIIPGTAYNWEFATSDGSVILPGHLFEGVEMNGDSVVLEKLRDDVDLSKYFGDGGDLTIEGRCVALVPSPEDKDELKLVKSDPMVRVVKTKKQPKPTYVDKDVLEEDKPRAQVTGAEDGKVVAKEDESITLKCGAVDYQTGASLSGLDYFWEVQTQDGQPVDTSALAEKVELMPSSDKSEFELKLTKLRHTANGLRLRCILTNSTTATDLPPDAPRDGLVRPGHQLPGEFIDFVVEGDPDKPGPKFDSLKDLHSTIPDSDQRKAFRVQVHGLDESGNLAGRKDSDIVLRPELIDTFTNKKAEVPEGGDVAYGLEVSNADGSPGPLNQIANSVEIDGKTGEIKLVGYRADQHNPNAKDLRMRVVAERTQPSSATEPEKRQRFASPYFYPVLVQEDGEPVEDPRPDVQKLPELKPMVVGLSDCGNLPIEEGTQKILVCDVKSSTDDVNKLLYGWELRLENGEERPLSGFIADFSKQSGNKLELLKLFKPTKRVFGRCAVARPDGDGSKYFSEYFEIGATCEPDPKTRVKVDVQDIPRHNPEEKAFECIAYDSLSGARLENATFDWRFVSPETGKVIPPGLLFAKVTTEGSRLTLDSMRDDVDLATLTGSNKLHGECVVEVPKSPDGLDSDKYSSGPQIFIERDATGASKIETVDEVAKKKFRFRIDGVKDGKVVLNEGDNSVISCTVEDPDTRRPLEGIVVNWAVEYQDGSAVDTSALARSVTSIPLPSGSALRLQGIRKTAEGLRAKCVGVSTIRGLGTGDPAPEDSLIDPKEEIESPFVEFDVKPMIAEEEPEGEPGIPKPPSEDPKDFKFVIGGLDDEGKLSVPRGSSKVLDVKLVDPETGEELPKDPKATYGVELQRADKTPAPLGVLADTVEVQSETGELKIEGYRGDTLDNNADDLFLQFVVERPDPDEEAKTEKFKSKPIPVKTLTESGEPIPDTRRRAIRLPDLKPIVLGLGKCGKLEFKEDDDVTLKCKARGLAEDDDNLVYAWEVIKPGSSQVSIAGTLAKSVEQEGSKLRLIGMRSQPATLFGRCLIARKSGNGARYGSYYFPIGGQCDQKTDIMLKVEDVPTRSLHERKFKCKAILVDTGAAIQGGTFQWEFASSSGEVILPSHIFSKVEIDGDTILLSRPIPEVDLTKFLGPNDGEFIIGRCRVLPSEDGDKLGQSAIPPSDPFMVISPVKDGEDAGKPKFLETVDVKDEKPEVVVKGADNNRVALDEGDSITLRCEAKDIFKKTKVEGLTHVWEIRTKDSRPVDTSALAESVEVLPSGEIRLTGLRQSASGLRARCVLVNGSSPEAGEPKDLGALPAGEAKAGEFVDFDVKPDPSKEPEFNSTKAFDIDTTEPSPFKVKVEGLDDRHALSAQKGAEVSLKGKLLNVETGEEETERVRFGLEASYSDGSPAPLNLLGDSVSVDASTGEIKVNGFKGDALVPQKGSLRIRVVAVRDGVEGDPPSPARTRYASDYIPLIILDEGGLPVEDTRPSCGQFDPVSPTVEGLSPCGNLLLQQGQSASVYCKATGNAETEDQFVVGWEFLDAKGSLLPLAGLISSSAVAEGSSLHLTNVRQPSTPMFGRCVVSRKAGDDTRYFSSLFQIGGECAEAVPLTTPAPSTEETIPTDPNSTFTGEASDNNVRIRFQLTGINPDRLVIAKPGENATITCAAFDEKTNESIPDAKISWEFADLELNRISPMRIANKVFTQGNNAIIFIDLRNEPKAGGRCLVTLDSKATISTPFFYFHVTDDGDAPPTEELPNGKTTVKVQVEGLNDLGQVSVKQIGDDVQLTCKAVKGETGEEITENVRYGWEWRYLDNDPAMTSNVAVGIRTDGDSMELHGIRAPEGFGGRGIKGRCVLHIPNRVIEPEAPHGDAERKFSSPYFTVVVDRLPAVSQPPVPGHPIDGIIVEISGATDGELKASQGSDAKLDCVVKNATTGKPISAALYAIVYGWEFRDASGSAVDSSFFANAVNIEPHGSIRLSGLSAPLSGRFPMRIRCYATLAPRLLVDDKAVPQPRFYTSDFVGLLIVRQDGTVTAPLPGQPEPDVQGNRVLVEIKGLHPSGELRKMPGENAELECVATDAKTNRPIEDGQVTYDWSLIRPNGQRLSTGQIAREVVYDGPRIVLNHVKMMDGELGGSKGRCEVVYNGQLYTSPFFLFDFTPKRPDEIVEGDGKLIVHVEGADDALGAIRLPPGDKILRCFAVDAKSMQPETDVSYVWEYDMSLGRGLPYMPDVMDPERVKTFKEGPNGYLTLTGTSDQRVDESKVSRVRCRVFKDGASYTSKYYDIRMEHEDIEAQKPDDKLVPKYWPQVTGLDDEGRVSADPNDAVTLGCQAIDTLTGEKVNNVDYLWELRGIDGRMVDPTEISAGAVNFKRNQLIIDAIRAQYGTVKGRCVVVDRTTKEQFPSPYFIFAVPPSYGPEEVGQKLPLVKDAQPEDTRVKVWVSELNDLGNLNGMVGQDASLQCHAEPQVDSAYVVNYSWQFVDHHGQPLSPSALANEISTTDAGVLQMSGLRAHKDPQGYFAVAGRCLAHVDIEDAKGLREQLRFPSKYFHVVVRDTESPVLPRVPEDSQGEFVVVEVEGLDKHGNLRAEPGAIVTLTCKARDVNAGDQAVSGGQAWSFSDSLGREVSIDRLAMSAEKSGHSLILTHLRPTVEDVIIRGKCIVFSDKRKRFYSSVPFEVTVKRVKEEAMEDDDVAVEVTGDIADGAFTGTRGGEGTLYCSATDTKTGEAVSAKTEWEFEVDGQLRSLDSLAGDIAGEVVQTTSPVDPQASMLHLKAISGTSQWTRMRCKATVTKEPEEAAAAVPVGKTYYSPFVSSGALFEDKAPRGPIITDPNISIRVHGLDEDNTVVANVGDDRTLECSAIDMTTGQPIKKAKFTWSLHTVDDQPLITSRLAEQVHVIDGELRLSGLQESSRFARARCLAKLPPKDGEVEEKPKRKPLFYASPVVSFNVTRKEGELVPPEPEIDISSLMVEVQGISPSGSLTDVAGSTRTLECVVTDKWKGAPIVEGVSIGWVLATGPDNQPIEVSRLADKVEFSGTKLTLTGLHATVKHTGGLRGQCVASVIGGDAVDGPVVNSDVFAIHIAPKPSIGPEEPKDREDEEEDKVKGLPDTWLPGPEPKDAVVVIIHELNRDGELEGNVGANATLTCVAHDTKTQEQLKVGSPEDGVSPRFGWEIRDQTTGEEVNLNELVSGQVIVTQTAQGVDAPDASAASRLRLHGLRSTVGRRLHGRCTVRLDGQRYRSAYFPISIGAKRIPGSVTTAGEIPSYYADDNAISVVVTGIDADGGKLVMPGNNVSLTCTAMNTKSKIPLPEKTVSYGWRLVDADGREIPPERLESLEVSGSTLDLTKVSYRAGESGSPEPIYGWCVAGVKQPTAFPPLLRYRSDTFIIYPTGEPEVSDKPDITLSVTNVGGDEDFLVRPDENIEMLVTVTDTKTGEQIPPEHVKIGWEWTDVSGSRPINLGEFAAGGEEITDRGNYNAYDVRLPQTVRGRAVAVYTSPEDGRKWRYTSNYVFLSPDRDAALGEGEEPVKEIPFDEGDDGKVVLKVSGLNENGQFVVPVGGEAEISVVANDAESGEPLTDKTEPSLLGYGWEVVEPDSLHTHTADLADSIKMDSKTGKFTVKNLRAGDRQVLLRMTALVEAKEDEGKDARLLHKRYKSDLIPLVPEGSNWPAETAMDLTGKGVTVTVEGLDENGDVVVNAGENVELRAVVKDTSGAAQSVKGYSWTFIDRKGYPVAPSSISRSVQESSDGSIKLSVIQPSAISDGVRGICRVAVEREGEAGPQYYQSKWFAFKAPPGDGSGTTDRPDISTGDLDYGFNLTVKSDSSVIYPIHEGYIVMARPHLPLELDCIAEFAEGVSPRLSESGRPIPQLSWFYRRPEIPGDVPIPAELFPVRPGKLETLLISEVNDQAIRISSDHYDFRNDLAEFQCHAFDGDKTLAKQTVYINRVKERLRVQVFDEDSRTAVYALENSKTTLSCYVEDEIEGGQVDPLSYKWEIYRPEQGWDEIIKTGELAATVTGVDSKDLALDGLVVSEGDQLSSNYQVRCVAQLNDTYYTVSRGFAVNVHRTPELKSIRLIREKPQHLELTAEPAKDIYDAGFDYLVSCKPDFSAGDVQAVWEKFDAEFDDWDPVSPPSDQLFFVADSTEYQDEGRYRCRINLSLQDYGFHLIRTRELELSRIAGPAPSSRDQQTFTVNDELMLQCTDRSASPQVEVEWSFAPSGVAPPAGKEPLTIGSYFQHERTSVFIIPRGQLLESHSGTYTCTRTNEHGQATTTIIVAVKPDTFEAV
uniref:Basement membrane proteoglycan n=1 Tax=Mesocestoides corti TaxID=53468 RepID=A0A5K3FB14_MESCO